MANPESIDDNLWGRVDAERWRDTPCVARRVALEDDAKSGHAVFFVENPSELDSSAMNLDLPCCALLNEEGEISPVLIVQAERHGAQTLIGYRPLSGGNGICTLEEVVLLNGPDSHFGLGFSELSLTLENCPAIISPKFQEVLAALESLTPRGGPGFLVLEAANGDYAQVAGGGGLFTAEWREHRGTEFRHWVAGLPDRPAVKAARIPTNDAYVTVSENECLQIADVKEIVEAFFRRKQRPSRFAWREITREFL
jgi:hypothetical protein